MARPRLAVHCAYLRFRTVLLSVGFGLAVCLGTGWMLNGPLGVSDAGPARTETAFGPGRGPGAPAPARDRLRANEQIHRIYLCTLRSQIARETDELERSWSCVATSDDS
jgi:hypothetical protein